MLSIDNINPHVKKMEYAVRGPIVIRAGEIEQEMAKVTIEISKFQSCFILGFMGIWPGYLADIEFNRKCPKSHEWTARLKKFSKMDKR